MANSSTHIDGIISSQASKEVTANAFFDAASPATLYGRRQSQCSGLTWAYYGGNVTRSDNTLAQIGNGTLALTASATNYIVAAKSDGAVSFSTATTNWNDRVSYWRLYSVVTGTATVTSYTDYRELGAMTVLTPFDAVMFFPGVPTASAIVAQIVAARPLLFPGNLAGSAGYGKTSATASTVFDVKKNGSSVGSITFAAAGTVPTFSTTAGSAIALATGDRLEVIAPATPDATLANISFTLAGTR